jgi:hypothetical protein
MHDGAIVNHSTSIDNETKSLTRDRHFEIVRKYSVAERYRIEFGHAGTNEMLGRLVKIVRSEISWPNNVILRASSELMWARMPYASEVHTDILSINLNPRWHDGILRYAFSGDDHT